MFDIVRDNPKSVHTKVEGWIQRDLAVDLFEKAGLDFEALKKQAQTRAFKPVELKDESFSANYSVDQKTITSHNIVGKVEGSKRPDEVMIYTAHWDHLASVRRTQKATKYTMAPSITVPALWRLSNLDAPSRTVRNPSVPSFS